jgi:hypothetical protein
VTDHLAVPLLVAGYSAAVPVTAFVPGFLRLWRRRESALYAAAQVGGLLVAAGWAARGNAVGAAVNGAWVVGLAVAYAAEGRKRERLRSP